MPIQVTEFMTIFSCFWATENLQDFEPNGRFGQKEMMEKEANDEEMAKKIKWKMESRKNHAHAHKLF